MSVVPDLTLHDPTSPVDDQALPHSHHLALYSPDHPMPPKPFLPARVTRSRSSALLVTPSASVTTVSAIAVPSVEVDAAVRPPPRKKAKRTVKNEVKAEPSVPRAPRTPPPPFSLPACVAHLTAVDARFGPLFASIPARPFVTTEPHPEDIDPFRTLVTSIIGQQVSWMAAKSITRRFVEHFCGEVDSERQRDGPFPRREQVANADVMALKGVGCSTRKAEYLIELAQHFISGRLTDDLLLNGSDEEIAEALIAVRGIGRWTVDMLLIFTLRRQDILPVGDLGVQKGLLRWVLAAHGELPPSTPKTPKTPKSPKGTPKKRTANSTPLTATPLPSQASQTTEIDLSSSQRTETTDVKRSSTPPPTLTPSKPPATPSNFPSTPGPPPVTPSASTNPMLPPKAPDSILATPEGWDHICAYRAAPLPPGLSLNELKARLAGKKAKGGVYLLPAEMETLTDAWRPYRSVAACYTWSMAGEN